MESIPAISMDTGQFCIDSMGEAINILILQLRQANSHEAPDIAQRISELTNQLWGYAKAPQEAEIKAIQEELKQLSAFKELMSAKGYYQQFGTGKPGILGQKLG